MTKEECLRAAKRLRSMYNLLLPGDAKDALQALEGYVEALDVCTSVERELVDHMTKDASLADTLLKQGFDICAERVRAILAERPPPDPVESIIKEMRLDEAHGDMRAKRWADTLDAARGRKP
jgi:hypothetical protein